MMGTVMPATPLVLSAARHKQGAVILEGGDPRALVYGETFEEASARAAQIVKRDNAYPELVEALRVLAPLLNQVPVFQLDDGKASVKAVRLAGKFVEAKNNAEALLHKLGEAS